MQFDNEMRRIPITGGHDLGRRTEETVAIEAGVSMTTFFFAEPAFSPSLFLFLLLRSDIFALSVCNLSST